MEDQASSKRVFSRRRRANVVGGRVHKHNVRVSAEEEAALVVRAAANGVSVPRLLVEAALADAHGVVDRRGDLLELFSVARTLGALGNNLNQIAKATNAGRELPEDLQEPLRHTMAALRSSAMALEELIDGMPVR